MGEEEGTEEELELEALEAETLLVEAEMVDKKLSLEEIESRHQAFLKKTRR